MADEIIFDDGNNAGTLNTGDSGINDGNANIDSNQGQGAGTAGPTTNSTSGTSGASNSVILNTSQDDSDETSFEQDQELVDFVVSRYLAAAELSLKYEELVDLYVENKLGFNDAFRKQYKKDNPDIDPDEIDKALDEELNAIKKAFTTEGSPARDELKKKYDDFKSSLATFKKDLNSIVKEFSKTIAEAFMPTSLGPVAPNPMSIGLKLFNGLTKLKKILDRSFKALAIFIETSKALGLDGSPFYVSVITNVANLIRPIEALISKQESSDSFKENMALSDYLETVKPNWPLTKTTGVSYEQVENWGKEGVVVSDGSIIINSWPMPVEYRKKVDDWLKQWSGSVTYADEMQKIDLILKYNDYIGWEINKFRTQIYPLMQDSEKTQEVVANSSNGGSTSGSANSSGGSVDANFKGTGTYGLQGLSKKGSK